MRISDWSSDVCSSDLAAQIAAPGYAGGDGGFQTALGGRRAADLPHQAAKGDDRIDDGLADRFGALAGAVLIGLLPHGEIGAEIGRASCRDRVCQYVSISVVDVSLKTKPALRYISRLKTKTTK